MKESDIHKIPHEQLLLGPTPVIYEPKVRSYCLLPYRGHPHGCPNFGKRPTCPPNMLVFPRQYDISSPVYLAVIRFAFDEYLTMRKQKHPNWTEDALRNPWHYQEHLRAELRNFVRTITPAMEQSYEPNFDPEAMGMNIAEMFPKVGLEWVFPPQIYNYRVAVIAKKNNKLPFPLFSVTLAL